MSSYSTQQSPRETIQKLDGDIQGEQLQEELRAQRQKDKLERQAYLRRQKSIARSRAIEGRTLKGQPLEGQEHRRSVPFVRPSRRSQPWYLTINTLPVTPYRPMWGDRTCSRCQASLLSSEKDRWCCADGKYVLPRLQPYPPDFAAFIRENIRQIQPLARTLNNLFSFSAIGYTGMQHHYGNLPQNVVITGRVYHRMLDLDRDNGSLKWFLFDDQEQQHYAAGARNRAPRPFVAACKQLLERCSPYLRVLRHAIQTTGPDDFHIHLDRPVAGGDIAAIVNPYNLHEVHGRKIIVSPQQGERPSDFVDILSAEYEPLQYPLFFPYGEAGWSRKPNQAPQKWTQAWWYRSRLLHEDRFDQWGRLTCEYLVDMYSRLEEERLEYIRNGKLRQARQIFANDVGEAGLDDDDDDEQEQLFIGKLPSCFLGSRAWISERVADALAVCRALGKPSLFITMTTNPNWPEIKEKLLPGQTAADRPILVCRAFKGRMDRLMEFFKSKRFGGIVYMISVVEFQLRGLPHAHILLKVGPAQICSFSPFVPPRP
jgi:hypothetical protein